jgi:hypothetical protein
MKYPLKICNSMERRAGRRKYRVLRKGTERPHSGTYTYTMKKALIVVALVQNHYLKVIQSLMHTVAGLL